MHLKKLGMALVAVLALSAVMASSAFAFASTADVQWYTGTSGFHLVLNGSESIWARGESRLIGRVVGTAVTLRSTALECRGCTISNTGGAAVGSGKLILKNVTVTTPSNCAARSVGATTGTVETKPLTVKADYMEGSTSYALFTPTSGTIFTEIELFKGSGSCPISGTYTVTGNDFVRENNATGVFAVSQGIESNGTIDAIAGGELKFAGAQAELNTTGAAIELSGTKSGTAFATQ